MNSEVIVRDEQRLKGLKIGSFGSPGREKKNKCPEELAIVKLLFPFENPGSSFD